ncbi:MAG: pyridoxine 5'-phosphate synthase [Thermoanaerobaculia bacterium]|nr:pyridoxine 5'-phosphate synthase [Thermoanaerobaculia bacterium]
MTLLSVNVDHVATLRQARRASYPDVVEAARIAEAAGASGITVHLRSDRRHIQDRDVEVLLDTVKGKLNVEMAATDEMLSIAERLRPQQVTLVPESPEEITTEGGLDLTTHSQRIAEASSRLREAGILVSLFLDPDLAQVEHLVRLGTENITGFEINTDTYTKDSGRGASHHLDTISTVAEAGRAAGFGIYAGHGLTRDNVGPIAALATIEELNIGHYLVARAVMVGLDTAVREMLDAMRTD